MAWNHDHLQPGDLYIVEGREVLKVTAHPVHPNGSFSTTLDDGRRQEFRGYFPDARRTWLHICGKRYPVQLYQGDVAEVA